METGFRYQKETVMEVDTSGQEKAVGVRARFLCRRLCGEATGSCGL